MVLKLYTMSGSQPCRAVELLLNVNGIQYERHALGVDAWTPGTMYTYSPLGALPCMEHDGFKLGESGAIMRYLAKHFELADHWYPADLKARARVDEALAWQHSALRSIRHFSIMIYGNKRISALGMGLGLSEEKLNNMKAGFHQQVSLLESVMLKDTQFVSSDTITMADLSICSELIQLDLFGLPELLEEHPKVLQYIERVKQQIGPYWDELNNDARETIENTNKKLQSGELKIDSQMIKNF